MSEFQLGTEPVGEIDRDAVHVAFFCGVADHNIRPGEHVGLRDGKVSMLAEKPIGIADPFRKTMATIGHPVIVCLYPGTVQGMRHHWQHSLVPESGADVPQISGNRAAAEEWLRQYAKRVNCYDTDEEGFARLISCLESKELYFHGSDLHGLWELDDADELRRNAEVYLGHQINFGDFGFSCSC